MTFIISWSLRALRFECQRGCTQCCEQEGFVYLTEEDLVRIAGYLGLQPVEFERQYVYRTKNKLRLRTPRHGRCHFLADGGCSIHEVKPLQCSTFPFWSGLVDSKREWAKTAKWCPGIGQGPLINIDLNSILK